MNVLLKLKNIKLKDLHFKDLIKSSFLTLFIRLSGMFIGYLLVFVLSRKLGAEGVGYYNLINQIFLVLAMITSFGLNISVLRYIGQLKKQKTINQLKYLYNQIIRIVLPLSVIISLVLFLFSTQISNLIFNKNDFALTLKVIACFLPLFSINNVSVEYLRGLDLFKISEFSRSVLRPLIIIILVYFVFNNIKNNDVLYFFVISIFINTLFTSYFLTKELKNKTIEKSENLKIKTILQTSFPMMVTSLMSNLMISLPFFIIESYLTTKEVGLYSVSFRLASLINLILTVVNTTSASKFSEYFYSNKEELLKKSIRNSTNLIFIPSFFLSICLIFLSENILGLFGKEFEDASLVLIILCLGQLFNAFTGSVGLFLNMTGNQLVMRNFSLIALLLNIILSVFLIEFYGIIGVAIATSFSGALWNLMCVIYVKSKLNYVTYFTIFKN